MDQQITTCAYQIEFTRFQPSMVCPLNDGEVSVHRFEDTSCQLKDGQQVRGVLVNKGELVTIA